MKKFTSILLCILMLLPLFSFVSFSEDGALVVIFDNDLRGSAAGSFAFTADAAGTYSFRWTDAEGKPLTTTVGERALTYTALYTATFKASETKVFTPQNFLAIPYGAKKLVVFDKNGIAAASYEIPAEKQLEKPQNYAYGVLSDLHFEANDDGSDQAITPVTNAFKFFESVGVQYAFGSGDIATNADTASYTNFANVVKNTTVTFLTCGGNHEVVSGYDRMYADGGYFYQYFNKGVYDGTLEGVIERAANKHDFIYQIPGTNDLFMVVSQVRWDSQAPSQKPLVEPETITWMGEMLDKYADKKVHLLMHTFLSDDDYTHVDGEGDISNKAGYGYAYYWNVYSEEDARLRDMLATHDNLIWFNGHSHWAFEMQKYNENLNIFDYGGTTATLVHVPSVTANRTVDDNETSYHTNIGKRSEGILMFSCDNYEIENGINFMTGEIYAYATYIIYNRDDKAVKGDVGGGEGEWVYDRQNSSLRIYGEEIPDYATAPWVDYNDGIKSVYVGLRTKSIGKYAFAELKNLKKVEIKEGTEIICNEAFENCSSLAELILPQSLKTVKENAFRNCPADVAVTFGGTPEEFALIEKQGGNEILDNGATCLKRTITWKVDDYIRIDTIAVGESPVYGDAAALATGEKKTYLPFSGWSNGKTTYRPGANLPAIKENITYTATFGEKADRIVSGKLDDDTTSWSLDRYNGVLTISGKKETPDFDDRTTRPWEKYNSEIYTVVVKSGITKVGKNFFSHLDSMTTLIFEGSVVQLGTDCFAYCDALTDVYLPEKMQKFSQGSCYQCNNLANIYFAGNQEKWDVFVQRNQSTYYNEVIVDAKNVQFGVTPPNKDEYTVTFVDGNGQVFNEQKVAWKNGAISPEAPEKTGYEFIGYDQPYFLVTGDMTVTALYRELTAEEYLQQLPFSPAAAIAAVLAA